MKTRAYWMLGLAVVLAVASVFLAQKWLENQVPERTIIEQKQLIAMTPVIVAATPLSFGDTIRREHLRTVDWPSQAVPQGSFESADELLGDGQERVALRQIEVNEPVLQSKVSGFGGRATLSAILSPDMRATTIRVNDVNGVAGFVLPGDHVDVLLTRDANAGNGRTANLITDILLQNVKVLGVDQQASEDTEKPVVVKAVTLEVSASQAQKLALAQQLGNLSLALRHITNNEAEASRTINVSDLRGSEANVAPSAKQVAKKKVAVTKKKTASRSDPFSSVRIVRALQPSEYKVRSEQQANKRPANPTPVNLLPKPFSSRGEQTRSSPTQAGPQNLLTSPVSSGSRATQPPTATSAPISLLPQDQVGTPREKSDAE